MEKTDLMFGDWVIINRCDKDLLVQYAGFDIIAKLKVKGEFGYEYRPADKLKPIELTSEILEKNITGDKDGFYLCCKAMSGDIAIVQLSDGNFYLVARYYKDGQYIIVGGTEKRLRYVHELQHALRLFGIEKEIEL